MNSKVLYKNEVVKRRFFTYLEQSKGFTESTIQAFEMAILLWEEYSEGADFSNFGKKKVIGFKKWLKNRDVKSGGQKVSLRYCHSTLRHLKVFFTWLSGENGYKSKINQNCIDFLRLSKGENQRATAPKPVAAPSLSQVKKVIDTITGRSEVEMRDKALLSLTLLTGGRISAIASLSLQSFDEKRKIIIQSPDLGVKTKFSKRIVTAFFPLPYKEPEKYFLDWIEYLKRQRIFEPSYPMFPAKKSTKKKDNISFCESGEVGDSFLKNSDSLRQIFKQRFAEAGVPYFHPHSFRHLLVKEYTKYPLTEKQKKAISQNFGHTNVETTFGSLGYGAIEENEQISIIEQIDCEKKKDELSQQKLDEIARIIENKS